jgi:Tol biopolymer transport system component
MLCVLACVYAQCNVLRSVEDCARDTDCDTLLRVCDLATRRCVPPQPLMLDASPKDASPDAEAATVSCAELPWGPAEVVPGLASEVIVSARLSPDEKTIFIAQGNAQQSDIFVAARSDRANPFRVVGPLAGVNDPDSTAYWPTVSADGKLIFFESSRSRLRNDAGKYEALGPHIWSSTRVNVAADFETPRLQALFDVAGLEAAPYLHPSGRSLYFASNARPGVKGFFDIFVADINDFGVVTRVRSLESVNSSDDELAPVVSLDELSLYHSRESVNPNPNDVTDIYVAKRSSTADGFGESIRSAALSSPYKEYPSWVSEDHCRIYFSSTRPLPGEVVPDGGQAMFRLWVSSREGR